ncbi:hypothetical protein HR15_09640 [Porphyromonas gulae]|uniref:DUF2931 domain-containing protein n=2 Tax=Porphyromonas gulae TaxID=111105 RepID=A0A0A2F641_9PORP|nr:hypothetical protein HR15_09640 [Porphyromonas gulae]
MTTSSCQNNNNMKKYNWQPTSSAPVLYPVEIHSAYMRYGKNSALAVPSQASVYNGLGQPGMTYSLNDEAIYPLPTGLDIVWLSLVDKKFYEAEVDFPTDSIRKLMDEGYINAEGEKETFDLVNVGLIPGGRIVIYLDGPKKRIELCIFQGKETEVDIKEFIPNAYYKDLNSYLDRVFSHQENWIENYKKYGPNHALWDKYFERFNYDIDFEFEEKSSYLRACGIEFTNGEACDINNPNPQITIRPAARPRLMCAGWTLDEYNYSGYFYLNEPEVLRVFDEAFGEDRRQKGLLKILVSKYSNRFDISLQVGGKSFPLKETQIRAFKRKLDEGNRNSKLIYKNYEQDFYTPFIGE